MVSTRFSTPPHQMRNSVVMTMYLLALIMTWRGLEVQALVRPCNQALFSETSQLCLQNFHLAMANTSYQERCPWPAVKGLYETVRKCIDDLAEMTLCKGWRFVVEGVYLDIHDKFFSACGVPVPLRDPPLGTLVLLITPGILFTLLLPLLCLYLTTYNIEMPGSLGL